MALVCIVVVLCGVFAVGAGTLPKKTIMDKLRLQSTTIRGEKLQVSLLLRAIGRKANVNIVVAETIADTISLDLVNVTLYDLFRLIMDSKALRYYESNQAVIVEKEADFKRDQRDVITSRLCPHYGQVASQVEELTVLKSEEGSITVSSDGNCLIVRDHEENVTQIQALIRELDRPVPQVHIKARIVTVDKAFSRELGIKWGYTDLKKTVADSLTAAVDLSVADPTSSIVFGFIRDSFTLDLEISALQKNEQLHILSEPRIVVLDGQEAEIKQGQEIPYESGTLENRNTSFREAVLGLKVIPKIMQNNFIKLDVKVTNDSVDENSTEDGQPLLNRQEIRTNLFLEDGVTVVIGGILAQGIDATNGEVPWLSEMPLLGNLFKNSDEVNKTYELLVFLTPTILQGPGMPSSMGQMSDLPQKETDGLAAHPTFSTNFKNQKDSSFRAKLILHPLEFRE